MTSKHACTYLHGYLVGLRSRTLRTRNRTACTRPVRKRACTQPELPVCPQPMQPTRIPAVRLRSISLRCWFLLHCWVLDFPPSHSLPRACISIGVQTTWNCCLITDNSCTSPIQLSQVPLTFREAFQPVLCPSINPECTPRSIRMEHRALSTLVVLREHARLK